jgi:cellulose synthase/poly-beta-1,6-N-acetylglucosamine synthase-like glycosyltransferase
MTPAISPGLASTLEALQWGFLLYFVCINVVYLALNFIAMYAILHYIREHDASIRMRNFVEYLPPVSILVPAHNEEKTIVATVHSLLRLEYPNFEVVVVNDGSADDTLQKMVDAFGLVEFPEAYRRRLQTARIQRIFVMPGGQGRVRLVDKENGGKADAINAGINTARYPLFCVVDADCILQKDSLRRVVQPFLEDSRMIATGGVIRVVNGCKVEDGLLTEVELPRQLLPLIQTLEYLRAFLFGRLGWSPLNALLIISGAFGVFHKERVIAAGGYRSDLVGEDMEIVVCLHNQMREEKRPYRIAFVPDPICWTEVPSDLRSLYNQRVRWQQGLAESLFGNWRLMFRRNGGAVGWLAYPFMLLFECLGPLVEVLGYAAVIILSLLGMLSMQAFFVFLFASVGLGILLSVNAMMLEEISFHLYPRSNQQLKLFLVAVLENFGYRQILSVFRVIGLLRWATRMGRPAAWGHMRRSGDWGRGSDTPSSSEADRPAENLR